MPLLHKVSLGGAKIREAWRNLQKKASGGFPPPAPLHRLFLFKVSGGTNAIGKGFLASVITAGEQEPDTKNG